ncbi:MAG: ethanolamine ammonia-lyase light chain EutC [Polyangia bacterium]
MNDDLDLDALVEAVLRRLATAPDPRLVTKEDIEACVADPRPAHEVSDPVDAALLERLAALTTSSIATGHAGNRFLTDLYLRTREGQADARDAVHSVVPDGWAKAHGLLPLRTRCKDRHEYLLHPNLGRRLDDASRTLVEQQPRVAKLDVQLVVGDGLSPSAIVQNGTETLAALRLALSAAGLTTGLDSYVELARIGVADELGVLSSARATVMMVGERPGLGTGDSLSIYIAVSPRLDQANAEKNCISNVRPIGITADEAAAQTVQILKRGLERGIGGVALGLGWGRS